MFSVDGRFGHSAKNTDGALEKLLMVIPSGDCCRTGLIHAGFFQKSDSSWLYLFFLIRRPRYGFAHQHYLCERANLLWFRLQCQWEWKTHRRRRRVMGLRSHQKIMLQHHHRQAGCYRRWWCKTLHGSTWFGFRPTSREEFLLYWNLSRRWEKWYFIADFVIIEKTV